MSADRSYTIKTEVMKEGWEEKIGDGGGMGREDRWRRRKDGRRR